MDPEDETPTPRYQLKPTRINLADLGIVAVTILKGVAEAFRDGFDYLDISLQAHTLYVSEKQSFAREAGRELEAIRTTED